MNRLLWMLSLVVLLGLTACGAADPPPATSPPTPSGSDLATAPAPGAPGYPARPTPTSPPSEPGDGYPTAPTLQPLSTQSYPADSVWILRPVSERQCSEDGSPPPRTYEDVEAAVTALQGQGITVLDGGTVGLAVCEACDCPSSQHYRLRIAPADLAAAQALGWTKEQ